MARDWSWKEVSDRVRGALAAVRGNRVLDTTARIALASIPGVGDRLLQLYDAAAGEDDPAGSLELREILTRLERFDEHTFRRFEDSLAASHASLDAVLEVTNDLAVRLEVVVSETKGIRLQLDALDRELESIAHGTFRFDPANPADRLSFFVQLKTLLDRTRAAFGAQRELALQYPVRSTDLESDIFHELRSITDHMRDVNVRVRGLLRANPEILHGTFALQMLEEHLSWWLAKYELQKENEDMTIVYVGVEPTNKRFPEDLDQEIGDTIAALRAETKLDDFPSTRLGGGS